jgi:small-conductance mechanosensitive channel
MNENLQLWLPAAATLLATAAASLLLRGLIQGGVARFLARTPTEIDDQILAAMRRHVPVWLMLAGLALSSALAPIPARLSEWIPRLCAAAFLLSMALVASRLATSLLERRVGAIATGVGRTSLLQGVVRAFIIGLGGLLALSNLGISVTPLLTALGVGSLAIALALQPTLSNLFAGMHISFTRPIRIGDFIELEGGARGYVEDIGWRATRIRELPDNLIVVPNARLSEMVLTNYSLPGPEQAALVQVGVAYGSDLEKVEQITCEVGREILRHVEGGVENFEPFIRYHTFGDSSIQFTVILRVRQFTDRYVVTHEFIKRLKARFEHEGIEIPFPQRVVHDAAIAASTTAVRR